MITSVAVQSRRVIQCFNFPSKKGLFFLFLTPITVKYFMKIELHLQELAPVNRILLLLVSLSQKSNSWCCYEYFLATDQGFVLLCFWNLLVCVQWQCVLGKGGGGYPPKSTLRLGDCHWAISSSLSEISKTETILNWKLRARAYFGDT